MVMITTSRASNKALDQEQAMTTVIMVMLQGRQKQEKKIRRLWRAHLKVGFIVNYFFQGLIKLIRCKK